MAKFVPSARNNEVIEAILLDLDDTLLGNDVDTFLPGYFALLAKHAERYMEAEKFLKELLLSTREMMANQDTAISNRDVFWEMFGARTGLNPAELEPFFDRFYREHFPQLRSLTQTRPVAADIVNACLDRRLKVVIATNPVFPKTAIEERLSWAGVAVTHFSYALVTAYENMHTTKPHDSYYLEILEKIECEPAAALMVGDNWAHDIVPADALGLHTYWISDDGAEPPEPDVATAYGSLETLYQRLKDDWLATLSSGSLTV